MVEVTFNEFELGQLYAVMGPTQLGKLSPELRKKLKGEFEQAQTPDYAMPPVDLATDNEPEEDTSEIYE
jgi:hypothetical protein